MLLRWNVQRGVAVIPRSQTQQNIESNISGLFTWELTPLQKVLSSADVTHEKECPPLQRLWQQANQPPSKLLQESHTILASLTASDQISSCRAQHCERMLLCVPAFFDAKVWSE